MSSGSERPSLVRFRDKTLGITKGGDDLKDDELRKVFGGVLGDNLCHGTENDLFDILN